MRKLNNPKDFIQIILEAKELEIDSTSGALLSIPEYEIMPDDFLRFSREGLLNDNIQSKVNSVSNLKRALDCQLDIFLDSLNLKRIFDRYNLKFEQKTKFLADTGILSVESINKLNKIRNKIEHEYKEPKIEDIQLYYDIVWYVVRILALNIRLINSNGDFGCSIYYNEKVYYFYFEFDVKNNAFKLELRDYSAENKEEKQSLIVELKDKSDVELYTKTFVFYLSTIEFFEDFNEKLFLRKISCIFN